MTRLATILLLVASGCATEPATHDLEIRGASIAVGGALHVGLVETSGVELISDEWFPFERPVTYGDILDASGRYALHLFYDRDGDGACSPVRDLVWKLELGEVQTTAMVDLDAIGQDGAGCAYFER